MASDRRDASGPEKLDLRSHDLPGEKKQKLLRLFPEIRTESGKIDFALLKLALGEMVDVGKERYGMHWPGKADCFRTIQSPSMGTLLLCLEKELTLELIRAMAERKPERVVCLDEGFSGNDQLKANAVQIFKAKGVASFKTV